MLCCALGAVLGADARGIEGREQSSPASRAAGASRDALQQAALLVRQGRLDEAEKHAELALSNPDTRGAAHSVLGAIRFQQQRLDESARLLQEAIRLEPRLIGAHLTLAEVHIAQGHPEPAVALFRRALELDPMNPTARFGLARSEAEKGNYQASLEIARPVLEAFKLFPEGLFVLATDYLKTKDRQAAAGIVDYWTRSTDIPQAWSIRLARVYAEEGLPSAAIDILELAKPLAPPSYELAFNLGGAYLLNGDAARALASYDDALRLQPESVEALRQAAAVAEQERELERSLSYWMRARQVAPDDPEIPPGRRSRLQRYPDRPPSREVRGGLLMSARRYPGVERRLRDASRAALAGGVMTLLLPLMGPSSAADVQFTDITQAAGIDFKHENSATTNKYLIETMGGGVAMLDVDNDGRLDLFFTNGARIDDPQPSGQRPDKSDPRFWNRMYRQKDDGTFVDVTEKAGLSGAADSDYGMGVAVGDYDNDGFDDLYVTSYGGNRLYRNNGDGTFADVTGSAGVGAGGWSASAGFFDYDNDGNLDLFVTRYLEWTFQNNRHCGEKKPGYRAYCHPDNFDGATNILYRNNGNGTFTDVSAKAGIAAAPGKGLGVAFTRLRPRRLRRCLCRQRLRAVLPVPQQPRRHVHGSRPARRRRIQRGRKDLRRHGRGLRRLRQRRSRRHHRHRPLERTLYVVPPERRRQLPRRDEPGRRRRRHAAVLGVEHALLRLRQRWLERPVRCPGARHGYHREDLAEPEVSAAAAALAERAGAFRQGHRRRGLPEGMGRPRRRVRRSGQRRRYRRGGQ